MPKLITTKVLIAFFFVVSIYFGYSQTAKQAKQITKDYNFKTLDSLQKNAEVKFKSKYKKALDLAKTKGWPIQYKDKNGSYRLKEIINGKPIYWSTTNTAAAKSTRTNYLHNGGGLGFNLEGQNMAVHIWEVDGIALIEHDEYDGIGGTNRFSVGDNETNPNDHAAHVTGTLIASGFNPNAKGMAPQAQAIGYNVLNDLGEAIFAASNGMLLSNHSYGVPPSYLNGSSSFNIGAYMSDSRDWDDLMFNAPYYLQVISGGNSGTDDTSNSAPIGGNANYDKLTYNATSKNNLVVANGQDAVIDANGNLVSVARNGSSSEGPTDDFRIKPDILGNGTGLFSSVETSPSAYATFSGTSMAGPNVCGSLLLLQQHYNNLNGVYMKAATLKGLALHTADDADLPGPDATTGWGLLNTKKATETISNNGFSSWISEDVLENDESFSFDVISDGINPLLASISWTDRPGEAITNTGIANDPTPVLINDLDIRITQNTNTYLPWKLTGVVTNSQGDNIVDPYERVDINGASGIYTITVTHKGNLIGDVQDFSLIVTGVSSSFNFATQQSSQNICSPNTATYAFNYVENGGVTTNFSLANVPQNATTSITPNALNSDGSFDIVFGNLSNVSANTYKIDVIGNNGSETEIRTIELRVLHPDFTPYPTQLTFPSNGQKTLPTTLDLKWAENLNAETYLVEVSTNPSFSNIVFSNTVSDTKLKLSGLTNQTVYYWRVKPSHTCSAGNYSEIYSFQVGSIDCGNNIYAATDFTDAEILETANDSASVPVTVSTGALTIDSIVTSFQIDHTWVNDISIELEGPTSIGNRTVLLFDSSCITNTGGTTFYPGDGQDFNVTYSDTGAALFCNDNATPSITGTVLPLENLSEFSGLAADGVWSLKVFDPNNSDGGAITAFSLDLCVVQTIQSIPNFTNNGFDAPLNATYTLQSLDIEASSTNETASEQLYTLVQAPENGILEKTALTLNVGDTFTQDDINTGKISYSNTNLNPFNDSFKVDITNTAAGWLPNQTINLNNTLNLDEFSFNNLSIWPNPTQNNIHIKLDKLSSNNDVYVSLYDLQGRLVNKHQLQVNAKALTQTIDLSAMQIGVYLIEIKQNDLKTTKRVVVK